MVLDSLEKLNVTRMSLSQPEKGPELTFDMERDMDEKAWPGIKFMLGEWRRHDMDKFTNLAKNAVILDSKRRTELELSDQDWDSIRDSRGQLIDVGTVDLSSNTRPAFEEVFSDTTAALKIIDPRRVSELNLNSDTHDKMLKLYDFLVKYGRNQQDLRKELRLAACIKLLFSQNADEWDPSHVRGLFVRDVSTQLLRVLKRSQEWVAVARVSSQMRLLSPNEWKTEEHINAEEWEEMRIVLKSTQQADNWDWYADLAANMKILAAEKVTISDEGLELTMPGQTFIAQASELPEQRNF